MNNKRAWVIGRVKGKLLPCRRAIKSVYQEKQDALNKKSCIDCVLHKLAYLSETEKERIDRQVMERATSGLKGDRFISKYQRVTLAQQFVFFLLVMLSAFIMAILVGGTAGVVQRVIEAHPTQAPTPSYKLIQQK